MVSSAASEQKVFLDFMPDASEIRYAAAIIEAEGFAAAEAQLIWLGFEMPVRFRVGDVDLFVESTQRTWLSVNEQHTLVRAEGKSHPWRNMPILHMALEIPGLIEKASNGEASAFSTGVGDIYFEPAGHDIAVRTHPNSLAVTVSGQVLYLAFRDFAGRVFDYLVTEIPPLANADFPLIRD